MIAQQSRSFESLVAILVFALIGFCALMLLVALIVDALGVFFESSLSVKGAGALGAGQGERRAGMILVFMALYVLFGGCERAAVNATKMSQWRLMASNVMSR